MRLPDITYGATRPLAKQDDEQVKRRAAIEIGLSKVALESNLSVAAARGEAGTRVARSQLAADKDYLRSKAEIDIGAFNLKTKLNADKRNTNIQIFTNLAQTAVSVGSHWLEAREDAQVHQAAANYSSSVGNLSATLSDSPTINLDDYPDVDFSTIPENMVYSGKDALTGQEIRSAPNHLAAPLVFAAEEQKLREQAQENLGTDWAQQKFSNAVANSEASATLHVVKAKHDHEQRFLEGQYGAAIDKRVQQGDLPGALDVIDSAEASGVMPADRAAKRRSSLAGDVQYSILIKEVDKAQTLEHLAGVREAAYGLPKETQLSIRSAVAAKENDIQRIIEKGVVEQKRATVNLRSVQAGQIAVAAGGLHDPVAADQAIVREFAKTDPEHLDDYRRAGREAISTYKAAEKDHVEQVSNAWYKVVKDHPDMPIPAEIKGSDLAAAEKYQAKIKKGEPLETNFKRYGELQNMAATDPKAFSKLNLDAERANFTDSDYKHFIELQAKANTPEQTHVIGANEQFNDAAKQAFGPNYMKDKDKIAASNQLMQAYQTRIEQLESGPGAKKTTATDRQNIINDLFMTHGQIANKGILGGVRDAKGQISDKKVAEYVPAISAMLRAQKIPVTAENIIKEYNIRLKLDKLKELDL